MSGPKARQVGELFADFLRGPTARVTIEVAEGGGERFVVIRRFRMDKAGAWRQRKSFAVLLDEVGIVADALLRAESAAAAPGEAPPRHRKIPADETVLAAAVLLAKLGGCSCRPLVRRRPDGGVDTGHDDDCEHPSMAKGRDA